MRKLIIATLLGATAIGGVAYAAQTSASPSRASAETITRDQFLERAGRHFERLDANKDGVLTTEEHKAMRGAHHRGMMRHRDMMSAPQERTKAGEPGRGMRGAFADKDDDGKISRAEFVAQSGQMFERLDANRNGVLEASELSGGPRGGRMAQRLNMNGDGKVTRAEFDKQSAERFSRMDANGDGYIDQTERPRRGPGKRGAPPTFSNPGV